MRIQKGEYTIIDDDNTREKPEEMRKIPEYSEKEDAGVATTTEIEGEQVKSKPQKWTDTKQTKTAKKSPDWKSALNRIISGGGLSDKAKTLLRQLTYQEPLVDWKAKLKKFFDKSLTGIKDTFPKRRFVSKGVYLHGTKKEGVSTLKTIVAAIDTSGSISHDQGKTFLIEVADLVKRFKADRFFIIYCSDDIHNPVIELKKGQKPDLTLWPTTRGNAKGFLPPFEWLDRRKIIPSVFIYLTDTGGAMPTKNQFNISRYDKKVFWFICSPTMYNKPTFGEIIFVPVAGIKKTT